MNSSAEGKIRVWIIRMDHEGYSIQGESTGPLKVVAVEDVVKRLDGIQSECEDDTAWDCLDQMLSELRKDMP